MSKDLELVLEQCKGVVNREIPLLVLAPEYTKILLDYINELQEKIDEAIDYIENNSGMISKWIGIKSTYAQEELTTDQLDNLLEILKGGKE